MRKKFILAFLVILLLWWLLQVPRIVNSLFLFFALGVNPFNNQDLSPVTMARLMALLVVVSVFVIFMKEWLRLGRRIVRAVRRQPAAADQKDARPSRAVHLSASPELALAAVEVEAETTTAEPEEPTSLEPEELQADADQTSAATMPLSDAVDYNPHTGRIVPLAALPSLLAHMSAAAPAKQRRLVRQAQQALQFVVAQGTQAWHAARQAAMAAGRYAARGLRRGGVALLLALHVGAVGLERGSKAGWRASRDAWQWFEPRARRFDTWLDKRLHQHPSSAQMLAWGARAEKQAIALWKDIRRTIDELLQAMRNR